MQSDLNEAIGKISRALGSPHYPKGDLADLKHMSRKDDLPLAFWTLLHDNVPESLKHGEKNEEKWRIIINGMALTSASLHTPTRKVGAVFAEFPKQRLSRFLHASGNSIGTEIRLFARICAANQMSVDWRTLGELLFFNKEWTKRAIAKDYVIAAAKKAQKSKGE